MMLVVLFGLSLSAWVKIATVLAIIRAGLGVFSLPGVFVTGALALSLSFFVMQPTISSSLEAMKAAGLNNSAPGQAAKLSAIDAGLEEWKAFVASHSDEDVVGKFVGIISNNASSDSLGSSDSTLSSSWRVLAPSFFISELRDAFKTGLSLFLPFVIIDILVAWLLALVGVTRLEPAVVSLPLKLLLFVLADGWTLIGTNLVETYI